MENTYFNKYFNFQTFHLFHLHGLWGLYLNQFFRQFSISLLSLYLPLYIFQKTHSAHYIFLSFILELFSAMFFLYFSARTMQKLGVDKTLVLGSVFRAFMIGSLLLSQVNIHFIWLAAILRGITIPFDWLPFSYSLALLSKKKKHFGKSSSLLELVSKISSASAPFLAGVILYFGDYSSLYIVSIFVVFIGALMPLLDDFDQKGMRVSQKAIALRLKDFGMFKHILGHGMNMLDEDVHSLIWPIILFNSIGSLVKIGAFQSASLIISILLVLWLSKYLDKGKYSVMNLGAFFIIAHWLIISFFPNPIYFLIASFILSFGRILLWIPFSSLVYAKSVKHAPLEFFLIRGYIRYSVGVVIVGLVWIGYILSNGSYQALTLGISFCLLPCFFIKTLFAKQIDQIKYFKNNQ